MGLNKLDSNGFIPCTIISSHLGTPNLATIPVSTFAIAISVLVWPLLLPFSSPFPFLPLPPPSVHLQPCLTPSTHTLPPSAPTLRHTHATPCYIHSQTSLRLMLDLLGLGSHAKGYLLYTFNTFV